MFEWFKRLDEDYVRKLHDKDIEREKLEQKEKEARQIRREEEVEAKRIAREEASKQKEKLEQERDNEKIYTWLYDETKEYQGYTVGGIINKYYTVGTLNDPRWRSIEEIASSNNLTVNRARDICCINNKLRKMTKEDLSGEGEPPDEKDLERWAIKKFVD